MILLLLLSCPKKSTVEDLPPSPTVVAPSPPPNGYLEGNIYRDLRYGFRFPIPDGWVPTIPTSNGELRLHLTEPITGAIGEIYAVEGFLKPPTHPDCRWRFEDVGHYAGNENTKDNAPGEQETLVAQCTPDTMGMPPVVVSCRQRGNLSLCVEGRFPPGTLSEYHGLTGAWLKSLNPPPASADPSDSK